MNQIIKLQLFAFVAFCLYCLIRLIGVNYQPASVWQYFFWGILIKDSFFLIFSLIFVYYLFNLLRRGQPTGPTIIPGPKLKTVLYLILGFWWLAIILHILFDPLQLLFSLPQFFIYRLANFLDETVSHIFLYSPFVLASFISLFLEIERPCSKALTEIDYLIIWLLSPIAGIMWGLNLTEGRLSLYTSFPLTLLYLTLTLLIFKKFHLKFNHRPLTLIYFIFFFAGAVAFSLWGLKFHSFPEFFNYLK
ncbi:MAG: hypothetical protein V1810_04165 [Candidatus Beckwithbacteria bacterium]